MKLIKNDHGDPDECGVVDEAPGKDAFGNHLQAGLF